MFVLFFVDLFYITKQKGRNTKATAKALRGYSHIKLYTMHSRCCRLPSRLHRFLQYVNILISPLFSTDISVGPLKDELVIEHMAGPRCAGIVLIAV